MKIALIDSHQIFTESLHLQLTSVLTDLDSVNHYSSIQAFIASIDEALPTLVITELCFNGKYDKGIDAIFRLNAKNIKVIVLTSLNDDWLIRTYMRLGAKAFLTKTCLSQELFTAIAQVQKGNLFLSEDVQRILAAGISTGLPSVDYLTSIERSILEALSREEPFRKIADSLDISMIELKYHRRMLMERFNVKHFANLVEFAKRSDVSRGAAVQNIPPHESERPRIGVNSRRRKLAMSVY